ncbi:MAG TPA: energy transducer TonB, partial [Gammaproteobacteria bacterium]|nr:energy transducer TonB [Gammaproteobacteria bacterium]
AAALALAVPLAIIRSTPSLAQEPAAALGETEFLQLVQRGPAGSDELEIIVDTYVADGRREAAAEALAGFMMREYGTPDGERCDYCIEILATQGTPRQHRHSGVMVAALELIEQRAERDGSGNVLLDTVLANALDSGNRNAMARAAYFVMRAVQIGIDESRNLRVAQFLYEQGDPAEALELARRLHDTEGSAHYQSAEAARWVRFLENELQRRDTLTRMIVGSLGAGYATIDGEYLPITKTPPVYPAAAAEQRLEGHVIVEFTVDTDGKPVGVTVVESSDSIFNASALTAANQFRYAPRLVAGTPVAVPGVRNRIVYRLE